MEFTKEALLMFLAVRALLPKRTTQNGGEGSGNFDHEGRPGEVGGSADVDGGGGLSSTPKTKKPKEAKKRRLKDLSPEERRLHAKKVASSLGFNENKVFYTGEEKGTAENPILAEYDRDSGFIKIHKDAFASNMTEEDFVGWMAHEIHHDKYLRLGVNKEMELSSKAMKYAYSHLEFKDAMRARKEEMSSISDYASWVADNNKAKLGSESIAEFARLKAQGLMDDDEASDFPYLSHLYELVEENYRG